MTSDTTSLASQNSRRIRRFPALGGWGIKYQEGDPRKSRWIRKTDVLKKGVEAVIDKDHTSAILARQLDADVFAIVTDVDRVYLDFGKASQRPLNRLTIRQCRQYLEEEQFPPGSMGPKITAAIKYLELGGNLVVITDHDHLFEALEGKAGTQILRNGTVECP